MRQEPPPLRVSGSTNVGELVTMRERAAESVEGKHRVPVEVREVTQCLDDLGISHGGCSPRPEAVAHVFEEDHVSERSKQTFSQFGLNDVSRREITASGKPRVSQRGH